MMYFIFNLLLGSVFSPPQCHCTNCTNRGWGEGGGRERELLVAKLLIVNISNKATGMFNKSEPLETYLSKVSGETRWDETGCSVNMWNPF